LNFHNLCPPYFKKVIQSSYEFFVVAVFFSSPCTQRSRAGACFFYLRPTAMPVGLAGFNRKKIALRPLLPPGVLFT